jgi:hypothetical protein
MRQGQDGWQFLMKITLGHGGERMARRDMVRVIYGKDDMWCLKEITQEQVLNSIMELYPELKNKGVRIEVVQHELGHEEWHIVVGNKPEKEKENISYFAYLLVDDEYHFIKDMHLPEMIKKIMLAKIGDFFDIRGLGMLKIANIHYQPHKDGNAIVKEICLVCNRVDA